MRALFLILVSLTTQCISAELVVLRHAQGRHNVEREFNSNPDHPRYKPAYLTETGHEQARAAAREIKEAGFNPDNVAKVYVSPLPRTLQTAQWLITEGVIKPEQLVIDKRLIEVQEGAREGYLYPHGFDNWDRSDATEYGGETNEQVRVRVGNLINEVKDAKGHVIFVTHGTPARQIDYLMSCACRRLTTANFYRYPLVGVS